MLFSREVISALPLFLGAGAQSALAILAAGVQTQSGCCHIPLQSSYNRLGLLSIDV